MSISGEGVGFVEHMYTIEVASQSQGDLDHFGYALVRGGLSSEAVQLSEIFIVMATSAAILVLWWSVAIGGNNVCEENRVEQIRGQTFSPLALRLEVLEFGILPDKDGTVRYHWVTEYHTTTNQAFSINAFPCCRNTVFLLGLFSVLFLTFQDGKVPSL
jgi:hypothetical protein